MLKQLILVTHLNLIEPNGKKLFINNNHNSFKKTIEIDAIKYLDKNVIWVQACGKSFIENILLSEDIINSIGV